MFDRNISSQVDRLRSPRSQTKQKHPDALRRRAEEKEEEALKIQKITVMSFLLRFTANNATEKNPIYSNSATSRR